MTDTSTLDAAFKAVVSTKLDAIEKKIDDLIERKCTPNEKRIREMEMSVSNIMGKGAALVSIVAVITSIVVALTAHFLG